VRTSNRSSHEVANSQQLLIDSAVSHSTS
jgi:hypothetical protein